MNETSQQSQSELMQWRNHQEQRQSMLREELQKSHQEIDNLYIQINEAKQRVRDIEE